jgi:HCOMODA/2-hydroxy-3-carboxy-muconic semialdehyde decarboxylase
VVVGDDVPTVVGRSIYLEINAKLQMQAIALGGQVIYLDSEAANSAQHQCYQRAWELWQRKITDLADVAGEA